MTDRLRAVRHRFATTLLPPLPPEALGDVRLLPHQRQAAARLLAMLERHRGALLADAVGLGKTFTALAVARQYAHSTIIAPATLVTMWQAALLRSQQAAITVHSLHQASVKPLPAFADLATGSSAQHQRVLVIIDEAHALRNEQTARYRHVAQAVAGCEVLLLSATPLHNRPRDLEALFALFRGHHANPLPRHLLATLIVRRDRLQEIPGHAGTTGGGLAGKSPARGPRAAPPAQRVHRPHTIAQHPGTLDRLLALPAPLPARHGAATGALIRLGLLRAWCSSDAALTHAITRRLQRAAALRSALDSGRHPTAHELASWLVGDEATDMQLGFPELLVEHALDTPHPPQPMIEVLERHAAALRALRDHHRATARADRLRAAYIRRIRQCHGEVPIVAFSQHTRTVEALFRALADIAGVGLLTSRQARIASGPITRTALLEAFAPRAHGRPPPPAHQRVTLLLATDLIAEGVNLQDAGVVLHLDLPWTHARRTQRSGRVLRLGSPHAVVHEYRLRCAPHIRQHLRIEQRVAHKAALAARLVGSTSRRSAPDRNTRWLELLATWTPAPAHGNHGVPHAHPVRWASWRGAPRALHGALVLLRTPHGPQALAVVLHAQRLWVSARPDALLALAEGRWPPRCRRAPSPLPAGAHAPQGTCTEPEMPWPAVRRRIARAVQRWLAHERQRRLSGLATDATSQRPANHEHESVGRPSTEQQQTLNWLRSLLQGWSAVERRRWAAEVAAARTCIAAATGAGCEQALRRWRAGAATHEEAVGAWRAFPELVRSFGHDRNRRWTVEDQGAHVDACLVLLPRPVVEGAAPVREPVQESVQEPVRAPLPSNSPQRRARSPTPDADERSLSG
ncbi:DEAD/DEAH box helicase [Gemmatimonas sp.]|uniref:DEAD/DEAH box helicase n=1 Tax=Gemmatimonas sp. TaxID=1962908 RepID=UPI0025C4CF24|nr:DEAD/DEAH box helicase [Gemmatimonas sp.]MCA2996627.1 DEAD/DEAH box helicase [Gemmatimonas sp.]